MCCNCRNASGAVARPPEEQQKFDELERYIGTLQSGENPDRRRGALIRILHRAQHLFGYLSEEVQSFVASRLNISRAEVYGVISFYSYFIDQPVGRYKINVCTGTACFVKGAPKVLDEFKRRLEIREGESTPDGKFFLGALRCVGACSLAPVVMVNEKVYGNVTAEKVAGILQDCAD